MLSIFPAQMNIYLLKYIPSTYNINFGNFQQIVIQYNIGIDDISCRIYLTFIYQDPKLYRIAKYPSITVGNIPWGFYFILSRVFLVDI